MRITFVHPAGFNFVPGQPDFSVLANRMPPIGILSLAAWLDKHGHTTFVHDCLGPFAPPTIEENAEIVLATNPEMIGFSATTSGFMDAVDMARYIKQKRPDIKILFGNVHASSIGAPLLEHFPEIDYLCIGEGEGALARLRQRHAGRADIQPGVSRRRAHRLQSAPPAHPESGRAAVPGLREAARLPRCLSPAAVLLCEEARRDHDHLARLSLHLFVLRPHRVRAPVQGQLRAVHLRSHEAPARQVRRVSHQLLRRPVHRAEEARVRPVRTAHQESAGHAVQLRHPHRPHLGRDAGRSSSRRAR